MSKIRSTGIGYTYHVFTRCVDQTYLLHKSELKNIALKVIEKAKERYDFLCFCFTIMDNHIHMILQTPEEDNISIIMQVINKNIATQCNKALNRRGHFWGERFHSTLIKSEEQLINTLIYLNLTPVKAGLVHNPKDWAWSSYNMYSDKKKGDSITDLPPAFNKAKNIQSSQESFESLVSNSSQAFILNFLQQQGYIKDNEITHDKKKILELLELYQKVQSQAWNDSISKQRTPKEFL